MSSLRFFRGVLTAGERSCSMFQRICFALCDYPMGLLGRAPGL